MRLYVVVCSGRSCMTASTCINHQDKADNVRFRRFGIRSTPVLHIAGTAVLLQDVVPVQLLHDNLVLMFHRRWAGDAAALHGHFPRLGWAGEESSAFGGLHRQPYLHAS
jgi:hypothetical protein